jgi:acyl-coenzyme A synthetase/AMP-(fatty) acid ligase
LTTPIPPFISLPTLLQKTLALPFCQTHDGRLISRAQLLKDAIALSKKLPDKHYAINLCQQRYFFIVSYLAVIFKNQTTLLPQNQTRGGLNQLLKNYSSSYCLTDNTEKITPMDVNINWLLLEGDDENCPLINTRRIISISFTSGSTGYPKAIEKSWREFQQSALLALHAFKLQHSSLMVVSTVPMQHMYGLESCLFWVLFSQLTLHNSHPFYPQDIRLILKTIPRVLLMSTPRHLKVCTQDEGHWKNIQKILSSTAPMSVRLATQIEHTLKAPLCEIYGSTETLSFASRQVTTADKWKLYSSIIMTQQQGDFFIKGGHLTTAIRLDDTFCLEKKGYFKSIGRSNDLIKIAGKRASLIELNQLLIQLPNVEDGVFLKLKTDRLAAIVVSNLLKKEILNALKHSIDAVFLPRPLYFVPKLPRNETGKLIQSELTLLIQGLHHA